MGGGGRVRGVIFRGESLSRTRPVSLSVGRSVDHTLAVLQVKAILITIVMARMVLTVIRMVRIPLRMVRVVVRKARIGIRLFKTVHHRMTRTVTMKRQNIHYYFLQNC